MFARFAVVLAAGLFVLTGCAPKFRVDVPQGWKVVDEQQDEAGSMMKMLSPVQDERIKVLVGCSPDEEGAMETAVAQNLAAILQVGGQITEFDAAEDHSVVRLSAIIENEDAGQLTAKLVLKKDSKGKGKMLTIVGIWPADQDAVIGPDFDKIVASADFR